MERKDYFRNVYSAYWMNRRQEIGFEDYDRNLCNYIIQQVPRGGTLLDVGVGTGYPIADHLQKSGYKVHGVDVSPRLIEECRLTNPQIVGKVGDAEKLDYAANSFDLTYSFLSSWYFPNLNKVIDEMARVTRGNGLVMFDIQNRNNRMIDRGYRNNLFADTPVGRAIRTTKNIGKLILRRGKANWNFGVCEAPTYPEDVYRHLNDRGLVRFDVLVRKDDQSIEKAARLNSLEDYWRLVFVVRK